MKNKLKFLVVGLSMTAFHSSNALLDCTASKCRTLKGMQACVKSGNASESVLGSILPENPNCVKSFIEHVCNKNNFREGSAYLFETYDGLRAWTAKEMCAAADKSLLDAHLNKEDLKDVLERGENAKKRRRHA